MGITTLKQRAPYVEHFTFALIVPRLLLMGQLGLIGGFGIILIGLSGLNAQCQFARESVYRLRGYFSGAI